MNTWWKRAASVGLSTCLVMTALTGCSQKEEFDAAATAITVNGDTISAGLVKFASHYMQSQYETMYASFGYTGIINQDLYGEGTTLGDSIKSSMESELTRLVLAEQHMDEYGVALTDDQKAAVSDAAAAFIADNDAELLEKLAADQATVERYLELLTVQDMMEEAMAADVDTEVSDEEAAQRKIQYTVFTFAAETEAETEAETDTEEVSEAGSEAAETEAVTEEVPAETAVEEETAALTENDTSKTQAADETETEAAETDSEAAVSEAAETEEETETETEDPVMAEAKAKAYAKAEALIEKIKDGEDFETASAEVDDGAYCGSITFGADDTYREELIAATNDLPDGTLVETPVETSSAYYVVRLETQVDREATDAEKENIVEERKSERVEELYTEWEEAAEITTDEDVLGKIVFDFSLTVQTEAATEAASEAAEAEAVTEAETAAETETAEETEAVTEAETAAVTEAETAAETDAAAEAETAEETEAVTETETAAETEAVAETESETEA